MKDRDSAIQSALLIISRSKRVRMELSSSAPGLSKSQPQTPGSSAISSERIARNVAIRLKDHDKKFDGYPGEYWGEYVGSHIQLAKDYNLTMDQKLHYLQNVLSKDALRFHLDAVQRYATTFQ